MVRPHLPSGLRHRISFDLGHKLPSSTAVSKPKSAQPFAIFRYRSQEFFLHSPVPTTSIFPCPFHRSRFPLRYIALVPFRFVSFSYFFLFFLSFLPRVYLRPPRLHHHARPSSILTVFRSAHHPGTFDLNHIANLNSYGYIGWSVLLLGLPKPFAPTL